MKRILGRLAAGAIAGMAGTLAMSMVMLGGKVTGLLGEPPPAKLTRRILRPFGIHRRRPLALAIATAASHMAYGVGLGALFALLPRTRSGGSSMSGALYGAAVWGASYAGWIPKVGLMPPPTLDRPGRPTAMVIAHLVYGITLARLNETLRPIEPRRRVAPRPLEGLSAAPGDAWLEVETASTALDNSPWA